jgi:hypothetical protein
MARAIMSVAMPGDNPQPGFLPVEYVPSGSNLLLVPLDRQAEWTGHL